jgi:signal transduction histidine kinase
MPADHEVIFDKFRQGSGTTDVLTDKPQGTGLGLPISRQIVEYFNGRLWVESKPGQGAPASSSRCRVTRAIILLQAGNNNQPGGPQ